MHLRPALPGDCDLLFLWRTEPAVVSASLGPPPQSLTEHQAWFARARLDSLCRIYMAETDEAPLQFIGVCRFNALPESTCEAEVSVIVAPEFRSQGWGTRLLKGATRKYLKEEGIALVYARIKADNEPSVKAFRSAGYSELTRTEELVLLAYHGKGQQ